ncbi:unnamed protein product [Lupinus luteus]|uniref:Carbonic anhydrase n=1 Tax=Lupinus luteus TaxID=3873 RepID=A0AAV1WNX9_LUPLU
MKQQKHVTIGVLLISMVILLHLTLTRALPEPEYGYNEKSKKGPKHWGDLKQDWVACNGEMQSPIDLSSQRVKVIPKLGELKRFYKPQHATLLNRGRDILVNWEGDAGYIDINGTHFFLQQSHWHWPSEHTINGRRFDLELHMVHVSPQPDGTNKTAVVGVLYNYGLPDPFLSMLGNYILDIPVDEEKISIGVIDPYKFKMGGKKYYTYMGSLTTPPCTEGVIWTINKKIRTVSRGQVKLMKDVVLKYYEKRNARPLQELNQREIQFYDPTTKNTPNN